MALSFALGLMNFILRRTEKRGTDPKIPVEYASKSDSIFSFYKKAKMIPL